MYTYRTQKKKKTRDYYPQETKAITSKLFIPSGYCARVNIFRLLIHALQLYR